MSEDKPKRKFRPSLSMNILIGFILGTACGIFFGEYCAGFSIVGNAFISLLQMTILPYIVVSLIAGLGRVSYGEAKTLASKAVGFLFLFWGIGFAIVLLMPLSFPTMKSASFFSTSLTEPPKSIDFVGLFIPANPFKSMANNIIPAVVLFSIAIGVALIGIKEKTTLLTGFDTLSEALVKVTNFIVKLTPIGVFAISANAAGTMTIQEFSRLQVYFITFNLGALFLTFWILPKLVTAFTPFKYKDVVGTSKDALITAFTTGNLFIILPSLIENCKALFEKYELKQEHTGSYIDVMIPVYFNFPNLGKLIMLLFILFAGWLSGSTVQVARYPEFVITGLVSFFGGVDVAMPFMLDLMRIPTDLYQLYIVTGILNGRFATLLAAMNLLVFTLLVTCAITRILTVNLKKIITFTTITSALTAGVIIGTYGLLSYTVETIYTKDKVVAGMQLIDDPAEADVLAAIPDYSEDTKTDTEKSRLETIVEQGVIRIGYIQDSLPFSFFNAGGELVGFDIDMAHVLAKELEVKIEFIPVNFGIMAQLLKDGHVDIVMSGISVTTSRLKEIEFSAAYMDVTFALVVKDHRRDEFQTVERINAMAELRVGVVGDLSYAIPKIESIFPYATLVKVDSDRDFFEKKHAEVDALIISAEEGSAWTLLYPDYQVVVPKPVVGKFPLGYPLPPGDLKMINFINRWLELKKKDYTIQKNYAYWILGQGAVEKKPRWSIIRDVLHWIE